MKTVNLKTTFFSVLTMLFMSSLFFSCSKDDDGGSNNTYPKDVKIKYEVSSTTSNTARVTYKNETGAETSVENASLPFSKEVRKSVKFAEIVSVLAAISVENGQNESVTVRLFIDDKLVDERTANSNLGSVVGQATYQFGR